MKGTLLIRIPRTRGQRLAAKGRRMFCNKAEDAAATYLRDNGVQVSKRGYPDFTVYNPDGSIKGFVEVKPDDNRTLKKEQEAFAEFCRSRDITYLKWTPGDGEEPLREFII